MAVKGKHLCLKKTILKTKSISLFSKSSFIYFLQKCMNNYNGSNIIEFGSYNEILNINVK